MNLFAEIPRFLLSFHYYRNTDLEEFLSRSPVPCRLIGDSGAFSAVTQGVPVSLEEYAAWIARWGHLLDWYANLDEIGDADGSWRNQQRLQDEFGLSPVPVFHGGEDWTWLHHYCERYPFIALGGTAPGLHGASRTEVLRWTVKCFQIGREYGTRFHGFGQTTHDVLKALPWYSCDSSSWLGTVSFGFIQLWDGRDRRWRRAELRDHQEVYKLRELIRDYGFDPGLFADGDRYERRHLVQMSYLAWMRYVLFLRKRHGVQSAPNPLTEDGFVLWLVPGPKEPENVGSLVQTGTVPSLIH